jgi:hypothetical protein
MVHIEEVKNVPTGIQPEAKEISKKEASNVDKYNDLLSTMQKTKEKWDEEDGVEDEQDALLSQAIEFAIEQGRGWAPGEKDAYLEKILDDDFIPPMFCSTPEELEKTGLQEAFTSLIYDGEVRGNRLENMNNCFTALMHATFLESEPNKLDAEFQKER